MSLPFPENDGWPYTTAGDENYNLLNRFPEYSQLLAQKLSDSIGTGPPQPSDPVQDSGWILLDGYDSNWQGGTPGPLRARLLNGVVHVTGKLDKVSGTITTGDRAVAWPTAQIPLTSRHDIFGFAYGDNVPTGVRFILRRTGSFIEFRDTVSASTAWFEFSYCLD